MVIAIPCCHGRVSPVFDAVARLLVARRQRGRIVDRREFLVAPQSGEALVTSLSELQVEVLLCAAISEPLLRLVQASGIQVIYHLCGEVEQILSAYCEGELHRPEFRMPGCWGHHSNGACCSLPRARGKKKHRRRAHML